jgi:hypothetical protein
MKGGTFPLGDKFHPLGARGQVKNGHLVTTFLTFRFSVRPQNERVEYDAVQYFADAGLTSADDVVMNADQQKLIKVLGGFVLYIYEIMY